MQHKRTSPTVFYRAKKQRREQTPAEARLWTRLRAHRLNGLGFRRQHALGSYIVDFCCIQHKLIIEVDGSGHLEREDYDARRTAHLEAGGWHVLRFTNDQILKDIETVLSVILDHITPS